MIRFTLPAIAAALTLSFALPLSSAQATVHEQPSCPMPFEALESDTLPAPTANAIPSGCETATRPWSAPVGHRQPQAVDVTDAPQSTSSIDRALVQENARVNRLIRGVCRGC
jgi:hypothetical protein